MMRRAFSMVLAIIFIVVIATIGMLSLSLSTQAAKQTEQIYLREQAEILALNSAELAILAMQQSDYSGPSSGWLNKVEIFYPQENNWLLKATIDIDYFTHAPLSGVSIDYNNMEAKAAGITSNDNIAALNIEVISNTNLVSDSIRIFKSTVQRP